MSEQPQIGPIPIAISAALLVTASVAMIVLGLPEATVLQRRMLELSSVPLSGAVALILVHLVLRCLPLRPFTRLALGLAGGVATIGVLLMLASYLTGNPPLVHAGQALLWSGLGLALVLVTAALPKRAGSTFALEESDEVEEGERRRWLGL
ncbi:MAG: hypothetical protein WAS07_08060 [Micropruina sp.]